MENYRQDGSKIYKQDEAWFFLKKSVTCSKVLRDASEDEMNEVCAVLSGKGARSILYYVGQGKQLH